MKGVKMANKKWKPVVFRDGAYGKLDANRFTIKCLDPKFVAKCLSQYQKWRRGEGEYEWDSDDPCDQPDIPFSPSALGIVENCAIRHLMEYGELLKKKELKNGNL